MSLARLELVSEPLPSPGTEVDASADPRRSAASLLVADDPVLPPRRSLPCLRLGRPARSGVLKPALARPSALPGDRPRRPRALALSSGLLALSLLALGACRSLPFPEPHLEGEYGALLKKWTRQKALYLNLETRAFAQVVYHPTELVDAQAIKVADMRAEPAPQRARTIQAMRAEASSPTFMVVLRTPERNWNDLDAKKSVWRVAIDYGGGEFEPEKVERIERPWSAELQVLYPYLDEYAVAYRIHFPANAAVIPPPTGRTTVMPRMVIAGALGKMEFNWGEPQR